VSTDVVAFSVVLATYVPSGVIVFSVDPSNCVLSDVVAAHLHKELQ
jgi:hypothetical protein